MARKYEMSWEGAPAFRWVKMYRGTRYRVSCQDLGSLAWTAEGSYRLANEWWRRKKAEIDGPTPLQRAVGALAGIDVARLKADVERGEAARAILAAALPVRHDDREAADEVIGGLLGLDFVDDLGEGDTRRVELLGEITAMIDAAPATPIERTVGKLAEQWTREEMQRVTAGKVGLARANMNRILLGHFLDWMGAATPVEAITEEKWRAFYAYLCEQINKKVWGRSHCQRIFAVARRFIRGLYDLRLIDLPRNLDRGELSFDAGPQDIETWPVPEIQKLYATATGQTRLHILLMCNCGFIGKDISDLRQSEIDWTAGTICRKRSKTRKEENVPKVTYKLWEETFRLLKEYRSGDPVHVLLTTTGRPWIEEKHDGDYHRSDKVASNLKYWMKRTGVKRAPKALRATAASKLAEHKVYKFFAQYFLGHSPRGVTERHCVRPNDEEFFEALGWLEGALGFGAKEANQAE
jgi:integrase